MRTAVAVVMLLAGSLMVPVATAGWWLRDSIVPTQAYVDTVAPLAKDKAVVAAVEDRLLTETMQVIDRSAVARDAPAAARAELVSVIGSAVRVVVEDPAFVDVWEVSSQVAHDQTVTVLEREPSATEVGPDSTVDIQLGALTTALRRNLASADVPHAQDLPQVRASVPIANTDDLVRAQQAYSLLTRWGYLLAFVALVIIATGVAVSRNHRRALEWAAFGSLLGLGLLAIGVIVSRGLYLGSLPTGISRSAAAAVFDTVTAGLRKDMALVALVWVAVLLVTATLGRRSR